MKSRKITALLIALVLMLSLAACGDGAADDNEDPDPSKGDGDAERSYSDGFDDRGFFEGVTARDIVALPEYKGLDPITAPSEETVEAVHKSVLSNYVEYEHLTEGEIKDGDTVNIDYVGSIDGVEFQGGSTGGNGTTVTIGVTSYIDDFLEQLIGHKPGENFDIEVTFPDPYSNNPDLAGKDAVFNITINYIQGKALEREIDEEIAGLNGYETVEDFLAYLDNYALRQDVSMATSELLSKAECSEIPQSVVDTLKNIVYLNVEASATSYGITMEQMLQLGYGYASVDDFLADIDADMREQAVLYLAVQAIMEIEGLEVSVEDIARANAESAINYCGEQYVKFELMSSLIVPEFLFGVTLTQN